MKKIFLFLLVLISLKGFSQYPVNTPVGSASQLQYQNGSYGARLGYVFKDSFGDTTAANVSFIKNVPGQVIRVGDTLWMRNITVTRWIKVGAGSSVDLSGYLTKADSTAYATFLRLYKVRDSLAAAYTAAIALTLKYSDTAAMKLQRDSDTTLWDATKTDLANADANNVKLTGNQTVAGIKTFSSAVRSTSDFGYSVLVDGTTRGRLGLESGSGYLSLYNASSADWQGRLFSQSIANDVDWYLPDTGNTTDTLATLYDLRTAGGGSYTDADVQDFLETYTGDVAATGTVLSLAGIVGGDHTFTGNIYGEGPITWYNAIGFGGNYLGQLGSQSVGSDSYGTIQFGNSANAFQGNIYTDVLTGNRAYTLPDASGQIALTDYVDAAVSGVSAGTETVQEYTSSTSGVKTLSNTPISGSVQADVNGVIYRSSNVSVVGTTVTLSGLTLETSDIVTIRYRY